MPSYDAEVAAKGGFIVVAATNNDGRSLASYSNRCGVSKDYCIAAPGGGAPLPGGDANSGLILGANGLAGEGNTGYFYLAGTSMAAPMVSGAVALVAEQQFAATADIGGHPRLAAGHALEDGQRLALTDAAQHQDVDLFQMI